MSKKASFGITADEPCGTTFQHGGSPKLAGASNTKRKASFGVTVNSPQGITFEGNKSHINVPSADKAAPKNKIIAGTSGQGEYSPASKGPQDFGGSTAVKGTMKSGKMDRKSQGF